MKQDRQSISPPDSSRRSRHVCSAWGESPSAVLCVYREVEVLKQSAIAQVQETPAVAIISYDEKPGVQAIGTSAPDLPPEPLRHGCVARDHEYVRHGTLSLLAGIDLVTGAVHATVEERHRLREFVGFLRKLDAAYPPSTAIKLILDNHSAHIFKETKAWLAAQPEGRFALPLRCLPTVRSAGVTPNIFQCGVSDRYTATAPHHLFRYRGLSPRERQLRLSALAFCCAVSRDGPRCALRFSRPVKLPAL